MDLSDARRRWVGVGTLAAVGLLLLLIPVVDVTTRILSPNGPVASAIENAFPTLLVTSLFVAAAYLARSNRPPEDATRVARWAVLGLVAGLVIIVGTIGTHLLTNYVLPTYLLAGNILMSMAAAGTVVGFVDARLQRKHRELRAERDRFSALFENSNDLVLEVERHDGDLTVVDRNPAFRELLPDAGADPFSSLEPENGTPFTREAVATALDGDESYDPEVRVEGDRGVRDFLVNLVDVDGERGFVVLTDITAQKERQRLLEERERELERAATEREEELAERTSQLEFLHSLLRHDVQNGMMVINSRAEFLADRLDEDDDLREYAETIAARSDDISDQIDRMRTTLDTLTGEGRTSERVDLSAVLERRVAVLRESTADVTVKTDIDEGLPVLADEMIDDVFDNVLRNAVVHNDSDDPTVEVTAAAEGDTIRVEVADDGPGIDEQHRDTVFRRGVTTAKGDGESGSGFGLFFVDTMVSSYDGSVWVEDNEPTGARFVFEFPHADA